MIAIKTIGERLNYCRSLLGKSRKELSDELGTISLPTLSRWELNTTKIPDKKIDNLLNYFKKNNIFITHEWLKNGSGDAPLDGNLKNFDKDNFDDVVIKQLFSLKKEIKNFWYSLVSTNFMFPVVSFGDYVGGILYPLSDDMLPKFHDKLCIVDDRKDVAVGTLRITDKIYIENIRGEKRILNKDSYLGEMQWLVKRP